MCEYCGCQDVPAIAALIAEHDELRAVARDAVAAAGTGDRAATAPLARRLLTLLRPHTEIEEQALFPVMAGEFADHVESLTEDHRRIEDLLLRVADVEDECPEWKHDLNTALGDLFTHILREQDGLFPATLSVLSPDDWDHLDQVRAQVMAGSLPTS
ncbi:MAG: hemerythrin domain-containing protein [Jatrophihabitans sp.]